MICTLKNISFLYTLYKGIPMIAQLIRIASRLSAGAALALLSLNVMAADVKSEEDKVFYYLGTVMSRNLTPLELSDQEAAAVIKGLQDALAGNAEKLDDAVYGPKLNELGQQRVAATAAKEAAAATAYLEKMAAEKGAVTTASGLVYLEQQAGTGAQPTATSTVKAHYEGALRDGTVFDSSIARGQPLSIPLNQVIPCWTEAIAMMKEGGKSKITCPSSIAYGERGSGEIPPGAALTFQVELIEIIQ
jgi:FKBP-type peptidyl-prolyl cis-trans isomerase FkpA